MLRLGAGSFGKLLAHTLVALTLVVGSSLFFAGQAAAQHKSKADDMEVPTNDMKVVDAGRE
jgi:hypothetical protein